MKRLEDHADGVAAMMGQFFAGHFREVAALGENRAGRGAVESREQIQQRGFARAGCSENREEFAARDFERDAVGSANECAAHLVVARDIHGANGGAVGRGRRGSRC